MIKFQSFEQNFLEFACLPVKLEYEVSKNTQIQVTITQDFQIAYQLDGVILRIEYVYDNPQILNNLEQIKFLQWQGQFGQNKKKIGQWTATWQGQVLQGVGGYRNIPIINYTIQMVQSQVYGKNSLGIIKVRLKFLKLEFILMVEKVGHGNISIQIIKCGGSYNDSGQKTNKWIELSDEFWDQSQVIYDGEYKNGKKVGNWDIFYLEDRKKKFKQIGGGSYDEANSVKIGKWIEMSNWFWIDSQVTYQGIYRNGEKIGRWDISYKENGKDQFEQIGGGSYNNGSQVKIGSWIEISEQFSYGKQITYKGQYKIDKKIGRWNITYRQDGKEQFEQIGGGLYDERDSEKTGKWIELSNEFWIGSQVTYKGDYRESKKVGKWDILYREDQREQFVQIGGGSYDEKDSEKTGRWIELSDKYGSIYGQITYNGEYIKGKKVGRWDTSYQNKQIGGGFYDEISSQKIGKWVELSDKFGNINGHITYNGEYKNGKKVGLWLKKDIKLNMICYEMKYHN